MASTFSDKCKDKAMEEILCPYIAKLYNLIFMDQSFNMWKGRGGKGSG